MGLGATDKSGLYGLAKGFLLGQPKFTKRPTILEGSVGELVLDGPRPSASGFAKDKPGFFK